MQKLIFGIFAHPDDEAFGVSPTLLREVDAGAALHLVTLTAGENGSNPDNLSDLGATRLEEWRRGGELMGASSMHHLGYIDGTLSNQHLLEISDKLMTLVNDTASGSELPIEFIVFDENGLSGHIDHIVATRAAMHAFYTLRKTLGDQMARVRLRCIPRSSYPLPTTDWIYMNEGRAPEAVDEIVDASDYRGKILDAVRAHHSQRHDGESLIAREGDQLGVNYFYILD